MNHPWWRYEWYTAEFVIVLDCGHNRCLSDTLQPESRFDGSLYGLCACWGCQIGAREQLDPYDANDESPYDATRGREPTHSHRMDNIFDHIECVRDEIERMFREYRASLDSARETILMAIRQAENGTRPLSIPIAILPLIVSSQQWQELYATTAREMVYQVFGGLNAQIRWEPTYYAFRGYLARRPYRNPDTIDVSDNDSLFSDYRSKSE